MSTLYSTKKSKFYKKIDDPETFRSNISKKLKEIVGDEVKSINIEKSVYNWTIRKSRDLRIIQKWDNPHFVVMYIDRIRTIFYNLNNHSLLEKVQTGEVKGYEVGSMTHQEMRPEHWAVLIKEQEERMKHEGETGLVSNTNDFKCPRCKSRNIYYTTAQLRSADEPETILLLCLDCFKNWRN
jgi:DNA-directed RNA polymerase subunit M/transcription elongation factor TFIIS